MIKENDLVTVLSSLGVTICENAVVKNVPKAPTELWIFYDNDTKNTFFSTGEVFVKRKEQ